MKEEAALYEV